MSYFWAVKFEFSFPFLVKAFPARSVLFGPFKEEKEIEKWKPTFLAAFIEATGEEKGGEAIRIVEEYCVERPAKKPWPRSTGVRRVGRCPRVYAFFENAALSL